MLTVNWILNKCTITKKYKLIETHKNFDLLGSHNNFNRSAVIRNQLYFEFSLQIQFKLMLTTNLILHQLKKATSTYIYNHLSKMK